MGLDPFRESKEMSPPPLAHLPRAMIANILRYSGIAFLPYCSKQEAVQKVAKKAQSGFSASSDFHEDSRESNSLQQYVTKKGFASLSMG